jgi:hypothetical protein
MSELNKKYAPNFGGKNKKRRHGRSKRRLGDNIKTELIKTACENEGWVETAGVGVYWRSGVKYLKSGI